MVAESLAAEVGLGELVGLEHRAHRAVEDEDPLAQEARQEGEPRGAVEGRHATHRHGMPRPDPADELGALLVAPEARHDVGPGDLALHRGQEAVGHLDADLRAAFAGRAHRLAGPVGDRDPGDLVVEELGVAGRDQRQDAEQDRDRDAARPEATARLREHRLDLLDRVERLGHHQVRAGRELPFEAIPLGRRVGGGRIEGAGDGEPGPLADRAAGRVLGEVEPRQHLDQADRIDVPDPGPGRVVADPRRVAGQRDDVADPERMGAEQLRLERHQVPVARRAVDEALEVEVVLDPERHRQGAHPDPGHRRVGDVDEVDAGVAQEPGGLDRPLDPDAPRRVDLDRDDEMAGLEELGQAGRRRRVIGGGRGGRAVREGGRRSRLGRCRRAGVRAVVLAPRSRAPRRASRPGRPASRRCARASSRSSPRRSGLRPPAGVASRSRSTRRSRRR